jgi:molecular chaperone GrpE
VTEQTPTPSGQPGGSAERIVIRDKRKISPAGSAQAAPPDGDGASMATPEDPATAAERATDETTTAPAEQAEAAADAAATDAPAAGDTAAAEAVESAITEDTIEIPTEATAQATAVEGEIVTEEPEAAPAEAETPAEEDGSGPLGAELEMLRKQLDEAQVDIKRVAAEYKNYRDRVKRDQAAAAELAVASVLSALLPVLDDLDRARDHGDLTGPFGSVAEQLLTIVGKLGLTPFGAKGDQFDPKLHEAVAHVPTADAAEETCVDVMRRGYMLGERLLRPAMVAVAAPQE